MSVVVGPFAVQMDLAEAMAQVGMDRAAAVESWVDRAEGYIRSLPAGAPVTASELRRAIGSPDHHNAVGAVFRALSAAGVIRCVGVTNSTTMSRRAGMQREWVRV